MAFPFGVVGAVLAHCGCPGSLIAAASRGSRWAGSGLLGRCSRRIGLPETELVPLGVLADREPAHPRDRHRVSPFAAELADARCSRVDVVDVEVHAHPPLVAVRTVDRATHLLGELGHVVLGRPWKLLELPPEERAVELACLRGVARGDLEVNRLACHAFSSHVAYDGADAPPLSFNMTNDTRASPHRIAPATVRR